MEATYTKNDKENWKKMIYKNHNLIINTIVNIVQILILEIKSLNTEDCEKNTKHDQSTSFLNTDTPQQMYVRSMDIVEKLYTKDGILESSDHLHDSSPQQYSFDIQNDITYRSNIQKTHSLSSKTDSFENGNHEASILTPNNSKTIYVQSVVASQNLETCNGSLDLRYVPYDSEQDEQKFRERVYVHNVDCHVQTNKSPRELDSHEINTDEKDEKDIKSKFHTKSTGTFWQLSDKTSYSSNLDSLDKQQQDSESENQIETTNSELNEQTRNVIKPKQERKGRSRLRNIIIRKRNCVSPSPAKHEELSRRSRSCPAFYKTFNADNYDCSSCVCCINSVHPIEETEVNEVDNKSDECQSLGDKTKSTSTLPISETEKANGNNLPNVPDTTTLTKQTIIKV
ncbi:unnamed protein product [Mytilus edulis]|uniref:Uncharacterized protein n=1 Tax=Mytilus edulis TaxID=6550 RepID=A0A8S3QDK9_MYTED|nr:unnamed protein product [Mytilus edulis]